METAAISVATIESDAKPGMLLDSIAETDGAVLLDSAAMGGQFGRHSIIAACPLEILTLENGKLLDRSGRLISDNDNSKFWRELDKAFSRVRIKNTPPAAAYLPGWIGYFAYEMGRCIEELPAKATRDTSFPDMRLGFYDAIAVFDSTEEKWTLVELTFDNPPAHAGNGADWLRKILAAKPNGKNEKSETPPAKSEIASDKKKTEFQSNFSKSQYLHAVEKCIGYIAAGDIFQVNLSQRFTIPNAPPPVEIYRALRKRNPSDYAAFIPFRSDDNDCAILSSSPELFVRVRNRQVITKPIKGTRPRISDDVADEKSAMELLASAKDNAELAMIIDLLRNDLGRVCDYGTVHVSDPGCLETYPTVFHLVGTITGDLHEGVSIAQLLRAAFPGGSITGAPKIRAMEIIDELEPCARGVYTGCVGIISVDGSCELNIAIRTIVTEGTNAYIQAGGGIVADSTPIGEYEETLHKARAMFDAIEMAQVAQASRL